MQLSQATRLGGDAHLYVTLGTRICLDGWLVVRTAAADRHPRLGGGPMLWKPLCRELALSRDVFAGIRFICKFVFCRLVTLLFLYSDQASTGATTCATETALHSLFDLYVARWHLVQCTRQQRRAVSAQQP
jgi:hypothetical protein